MTDPYAAFISGKLTRVPSTGLRDVPPLSDALFPFQRDLVTWALRRGRCALFADTGLGKTRMQVEWARHVTDSTDRPTLILAPLSVARQTAEEAARIGVTVTRVSDGSEVGDRGIFVTNYDRLHRFEGIELGAIVLDESSIIKHHDSKTLASLLERFRATPYKLACSATPSPNDYTELGTHAEFLGVCTRTEMLAEFFVHDGGDTSKWRLKGHARSMFWRWVSGWAAMVRRPSDLGYESDAGYDLPPMHIFEHISKADPGAVRQQGLLFAEPASTMTERRQARRNSLPDRVAQCVATVKESDAQWVVWCALNDEQDALRKGIGEACVSIHGAQSAIEKESLYMRWAAGEARVLVTKSAIFGYGINMQHCHMMAFVGVTDSWESYYQSLRRIWRFGQQRECNVHIFASELEGNVLENLKRKGEDARKMGDELSAETRGMVRAEVYGQARQSNEYGARVVRVPEWVTRREADYE